MPAIWTNPLTWTLDKLFEATIANIHIRDNLLYVFKKPASWVKKEYSAVEDLDQTTWTQIAAFDMALTTETGRLRYDMNINISGNNRTSFDVYIPELNIYFSSGTATPSIFGFVDRDADSGNNDVAATGFGAIEVAAGSYTFELYYKSDLTANDIMADIANFVMVQEF